jgi:hypothetical protein
MTISSPFEFLHLIARDRRSTETARDGACLALVCLWAVVGLALTAILLAWGFGSEIGHALTLLG